MWGGLECAESEWGLRRLESVGWAGERVRRLMGRGSGCDG